MYVGYARTSTKEQLAGFDAQVAELRSKGCEKIFMEQVSSIAERKELTDAIEFVREGDTLVVTKLDRLARSLAHLQEIQAVLERKKVGLWILAMGMQTNTPTGRLLWQIVGSIAEFERAIMLDRQKDGIAAAKEAGKFLGQKPTARMRAVEIAKLRSAGMSVDDISRELGLHRTSVYRVIRSGDPEVTVKSCEKWLAREGRKAQSA